MGDLDQSSKSVVDSIQKDFKPKHQILNEYLFKEFTINDIYIPNCLALKFIPDTFPTDWQRRKIKELNGFYSGIIAVQIGRVKEMEQILVQSMERDGK